MVVFKKEVGLYDESTLQSGVEVDCKRRNSRPKVLLSVKTSS